MEDYSTPYKIDLKKLIARLLPFFARGRKLIGLIYGSMKPIISLYERFLEEAREIMIRARISFQQVPMEWYLTRQLKAAKLHDNELEETERKLDKVDISNIQIDLSPFSMSVYDFYAIWDYEKKKHDCYYLHKISEVEADSDISQSYIYNYEEIACNIANPLNVRIKGVQFLDVTLEEKKAIQLYIRTLVRQTISQFSAIKRYKTLFDIA